MGRWHTKRVASALQLGLCENCLSIWCCLPLVRSLFLVYKRTASDPKQFKRCVQPQRQPFKNHCQSPSWNSGQNLGTDVLSRQGLKPREWRLYPETVESIWDHPLSQRRWSRYETTHCPLWLFLIHPAPLGLDVMVQMWRVIALLPGVLPFSNYVPQESQEPSNSFYFSSLLRVCSQEYESCPSS